MGDPSSDGDGDMARIATDPDVLEAFYRRHVEAVERFVVRRVDNPHLAADLIADIFLAAIDSAHTYRSGRGDPTRWLYGVARNVVSAERRRNARELRAMSRISGRALIDDEDLADLVERIDAASQARRLHEALGGLSEDDRDLLELVVLEGLAVRDAAEILRMSQVAARVRLHRARRHVRDRLARATASPGWTRGSVVKEASP